MSENVTPGIYSEELKNVIENIFFDLTETYLRQLSAAKYQAPEIKDGFPYSKATAAMVNHIGEFFRTCFEEVFFYRFSTPCPGLEKFVMYALSVCELFLRDDFPCLSQKTSYGDLHFVRFLMVCALLAELLHYCLQKDCYRHIKTIPKCMMIAYDRWLENDIRQIGGLSGLNEFCNSVKPVYDSLPCATARKVMGLHELSSEVKEIKQKIKDCTKDYKRIWITLSDKERKLISKDEIHRNANVGSCKICEGRCKIYLASFVCDRENSDSSPNISSEEEK